MKEKNRTARNLDDSDDAPDLSAPEWREKLAAASVKRGRPEGAARKTIRCKD